MAERKNHRVNLSSPKSRSSESEASISQPAPRSAQRSTPSLKLSSSKAPVTETTSTSQRTPRTAQIESKRRLKSSSLSQRTQKMVRSLTPSLKLIPSFKCMSLQPSRTLEALQEPLPEFKCPIHNNLMHEPVTVLPGLTFDRACIEACRELDYIPSSFSFELTPDNDLKSQIIDWCDEVGHPRPLPVSKEEARDYARKCMAMHVLLQTVFTKISDETRSSPLEPIKNILTRLDTVPSSSCFSKAVEALNRPSTTTSVTDDSETSIDVGCLEKEILDKLTSTKSSVREEALDTLYEYARRSKECKIALSSHRILASLIPKLHLRHPPTQIIKATAAIAILSEEPSNRVKIAQSGAISRLVSLIKNRHVEARDLSARALNNLALEEHNKEFIGSCIDAISSLVDHFTSEPAGNNYPGRKYAGMALCHLTLNCSVNLTRLARTSGAVRRLLRLTADRSSDQAKNLAGFAMVLIWKLAWISEAREELNNAGAVGEMARMMRQDEGEDEYCLAVMYQICDHNVRLFRMLAAAAGVEEVLAQDKVGWGEMGRVMASRMLDAIRESDRESSV